MDLAYTFAVHTMRPPAMNRRSWRLLTVILSLCALLFTQAALAGFSCEGAVKAVQVAQMAEAGMPCAESMSHSMNEEQPALCHAHCQSAKATPDAPKPPPAVNLVHVAYALTVLLPAPQASALGSPLIQRSLLRREATPSLAIANCCFRT